MKPSRQGLVLVIDKGASYKVCNTTGMMLAG